MTDWTCICNGHGSVIVRDADGEYHWGACVLCGGAARPVGVTAGSVTHTLMHKDATADDYRGPRTPTYATVG